MPEPSNALAVVSVKTRQARSVTSQVERNAYAAAHRILELTPDPANLACRGARRTAWVDQIARAIAHEFGEELKP